MLGWAADAGRGSEVMSADVPIDALPPRRRRYLSFVAKHHLGLVGLVMSALIVLVVIIGPALLDTDPNRINLANKLVPIGGQLKDGTTAWLGTDALGRDQLMRVLVGGRASLNVVLLGALLATVLGTVLGIMSGFYGGWIDNAIMRLVDAQLALPTLVLALFVAATLGAGFYNTALTLGIAGFPIYARVIRAEVLKIREEDYIRATVALGGSDLRLMLAHIAPNVLSSLLIVGSLEMGHLLLVESSLSFLGFGMQPPDASWGSMIKQGQSYLQVAWWLSAVPGLFIMMTVLGLNLLGDWLRDLLDPHMS